MNEHVLASPEAADAARQMEALLAGSLASTIVSVRRYGDVLCAPAVWDGPMAAGFRASWPAKSSSIARVLAVLADLHRSARHTTETILAAGSQGALSAGGTGHEAGSGAAGWDVGSAVRWVEEQLAKIDLAMVAKAVGWTSLALAVLDDAKTGWQHAVTRAQAFAKGEMKAVTAGAQQAADAALTEARAAARDATDQASVLGRLLRTGTDAERSMAGGLLRRAGQAGRDLWTRVNEVVEPAARNAAQDVKVVEELNPERIAVAIRDAPILRGLGNLKLFGETEVGLRGVKSIPIVGLIAMPAIEFASDLYFDHNSRQEAATRAVVSTAAGVLAGAAVDLAMAGVVALVGASMFTGVGEIAVGVVAVGAAAYFSSQLVAQYWPEISSGTAAAWHSTESGVAGVWHGVSHAWDSFTGWFHR